MATGFDGRAVAWGTDDHGTLGQGEGNWQSMPVKRPVEVRPIAVCLLNLSTLIVTVSTTQHLF